VPGPVEPDNRIRLLGDDSTVRPWLYGNWWSAAGEGSPTKLVGLGVRLGTTANIEDGEGNFPKTSDGQSVVHVYFHGSHIRIATDDSK
jgi:hypothetical protein